MDTEIFRCGISINMVLHFCVACDVSFI